MKQNSLLIMFITLLFASGCSDDDDKSNGPFLPPREVSFTQQDATDAIDAFNATFYDETEMLYFETTLRKEGKYGAIWTQAIYWDMIMNAYKRYVKTGNTLKKDEYAKMIENVYLGACKRYDEFNWDNKVEWFIYDDMMWWIISLARAHEITKDNKYLDHAVKGFQRVWTGSYDPIGGGMWWDFGHTGKTSCLNYPTVIGAMTLYNITKEPVYLSRAKEIYAWTRKTLFNETNGRVADNRAINASEPAWHDHVYNQGTCIGAAVMLYNETKTEQYLNDAVLAANYTKDVMCITDDGRQIFPYETGIEQGIYTAIFAQYIIRLIEDGNQPEYLDWLRTNINIGWGNREMARNIVGSNFLVELTPEDEVQVYDASGIPALMQIYPPSDN